MNDGNTKLPESTAVALAAEAPVGFSFRPETLDQAMKLADMLANSSLVPKDYIGKAGNCFIAMQMGHEVGLQPVQSLQSIAVINGKPSIYGDAGKALLLRAGCKIDEFDTQEIKAKGFAQCTITRPNGQMTTRTFSKEDSVTAGLSNKEGPWKNYPSRQMAWRAFWFAARDGASDILKGLRGAEEERDTAPERDITPDAEVVERKGPKSKAEAAAAQSTQTVNTETGEITPAAAATKNGNGQPAPAPEGQNGGSPPAPLGMLNIIRAKAKAIGVDEARLLECHKLTRLEGISIDEGNVILKSIASGAEAYAK